MNTDILVFERIYNAPVGTVWKAITEREQMKHWYFELEEFKPEVGFEFKFYGGHDDGVQYLHLCKVIEVEAEKKLVHTWKYDGYTGSSTLMWELFDEGGKTRVKLTHSGLGTFPANIPDFAVHNFNEGWTYILGTSLKGYLQK